jgi:hypothetical protein
MSAATEDAEYSERTQRSQFRYRLTAKHHGGDRNAAMWLPSISPNEEFSVFDLADLHEIADERGWLYGVLLSEDGAVREIGVWDEKVAEFQPGNNRDEPWHGYQQWPVDKSGPANRRKQQCCPDRKVFDLMFAANLINKTQRKKLLSGKNR